MRKILLIVFLAFLCAPLRAAGTLDVYFIDTEGGQSTLSSRLRPNHAGGYRQLSLMAAMQTGSSVLPRWRCHRIDYLVITHFHTDHVGGVPQLAARLPMAPYGSRPRALKKGKKAETLPIYVQVRDQGPHFCGRATAFPSKVSRCRS